MSTDHPEDEVVQVYLARDLLQAEFLRNLLEREGIMASVVGDAPARLVGVMPNAAGVPCVWVRQADLLRARELIAEYERKCREPRSEDDAGATWTCAACGEQVDDDFELCWNCQNPRKPY